MGVPILGGWGGGLTTGEKFPRFIVFCSGEPPLARVFKGNSTEGQLERELSVLSCDKWQIRFLFWGLQWPALKRCFKGSFAAPPSSPPHPISSSLIFPPRKLACWTEIMRSFTWCWNSRKGP